MKYAIISFSLLLCWSCQNTQNKEVEPNTEPTSDSTYISLDHKLDSLLQTGVFNGFSATIVDSSGILYNKGFGYADVEAKKEYTAKTIINIASVSKVFIGVALLKAQELELLNIDDPINQYLPFKVIHPKYPEDKITIRQLATHTSSIVDSDLYLKTCYVNKDDIPIDSSLLKKYGTYYQNPSTKWMPLQQYLTEMLSTEGSLYDTVTFSKYKPGDIYEYSNIGAALCALVIESAAQQSFNEFTKEHIFKPLNMSATSWFMEEVNLSNYSKLYADQQLLPYYKILSYPDGGLITSSTDLSQFLIELIRGFSGNGILLEAESYQILCKPQLAETAFELKPNRNKGYNTGLFLDLEPAYDVMGHTGGDPGVNSFMFFNTKTGKGRILITNTDSEKENSGEIFYGIWNALDND